MSFKSVCLGFITANYLMIKHGLTPEQLALAAFSGCQADEGGYKALERFSNLSEEDQREWAAKAKEAAK